MSEVAKQLIDFKDAVDANFYIRLAEIWNSINSKNYAYWTAEDERKIYCNDWSNVERKEFDSMSKEERCESCRYYKVGNVNKYFGRCYRYPPILIIPQDEELYVRPVVNEKNWCGEYKEKDCE